MRFSEIPSRLERTWDNVAAHLRRHPRKYSVVSSFVIFLPRWIPSASKAAEWLWTNKPAWVSGLKVPGFTWDFVTAPLGLTLLFLVWRETRQSRQRSDVSATIHTATPASISTKLQATPSPNGTASDPVSVALNGVRPGTFAGELEWKAVAYGDEVLIEIKNVNPSGPQKTNVVVWLDAIHEWSEDHLVPVKIRQWEDAPKGGTLSISQGQHTMFFRELQRYAFIQRADDHGRLRVHYRLRNQHQPILLPPGLWIADVRVEWGGKSETRKVCFRSGGGGRPPVLLACPNEAAPELIIHSAEYGLPEQGEIDVTTHLRELVRDNRLDVAVKNQLWGGHDPVVGQRKRLRVVYSVGNEPQKTIEVPEKDRLQIP